jgi:hypothetical protein
MTYADDTTLLGESKDDMIELKKQVKNSTDRVGLNVNQQKTTVISNVEKVNIFSDGEDSSTVTNYKVLVVLITNNSYTNEETKKSISLSKPAMANLTKIIKA